MESEKKANAGYRAFFAEGVTVTRAPGLPGWGGRLRVGRALRAARRDMRARGHRGGRYPFIRGFMCVVVRKVVVFGVLGDMIAPAARYATLASYDEVAPHSGASARTGCRRCASSTGSSATSTAHAVYAPGPYEMDRRAVDHGQTQGATFKQRNG